MNKILFVLSVRPEPVEGFSANGSTGSPQAVKFTMTFKLDVVTKVMPVLPSLHLNAYPAPLRPVTVD
jgi:hypothetical protein